MKTYTTCSACFELHNWRELDYNNVLYVSVDNAICITLCSTCVTKFLVAPKSHKSNISYKQKIDCVLRGESKFTPDLKKQSSASLVWGLFF
jgi:hypothetical protein